MFFLEQFEGKYRIYYDGKFTIKDYQYRINNQEIQKIIKTLKNSH